MSLKARLSFLVVGAITFGLVTLSVTTYIYESRRVYDSIDASLLGRARELVEDSRVYGTSARIPVENVADAATLVQVVAPDGRIVIRSDNLGELALPVDDGTRRAFDHHAPVYRDVSLTGSSLRMVELALFTDMAPQQRVGVLQVARPIGQLREDLLRLRNVLAVGNSVALVITITLALLLTRRALRPLATIQASAEQVAITGDPSVRLRAPAPDPGHDEVARLAAAFDHMLERLEASGSQLGAALDSQRRFVADASHELRTPLTSAKGNLDIVLRNPDMSPDERSRTVEDARAELDRMARLVDGLLTLARADSGALPQGEPVDAGDVIEASVRTARQKLGTRTLTVDERVGDAFVVGSGDVLRRLVDNLLDNSIKYTGPDGRVTLTAYTDSRWLRISVADDGIGIPAAELPRIFDRFYRSPTARGADGSGLGLAIVHWGAALHGGTVAVSSTPGVGTTFVVDLPLALAK